MTEEDPAVSAAAHGAQAEDTEQTGAADTARSETPATPAMPAASDGNAGDLAARVAELERQLATERDAATDYMTRWQRAQADFANFKRRAQQEQQQVQRALAIEAARLILPALDSFERAFATLPPSLQRLTWISGVELVRLQLESALNACGIQLVEATPGKPFDPSRHEAIGEVETAEHPAGNVAFVVQRGYQIEGYILRPALVQLAKAAESATITPSPFGEDVGAQPAAPDGADDNSQIPAESATAAAAESEIPAESATDSTSPLGGDVGAQSAASSSTQGKTSIPAESATDPPLSPRGEGPGVKSPGLADEDPEPSAS